MNSNEKIRISYQHMIEQAKKCGILSNDGNNPSRIPFEPKMDTMYWHNYYLMIKYTFLDCFVSEYCENIKKNSFVEKKQSINKEKGGQVFNLCRIEFLKTLYLIDSLIQRICDYNIDKSVFQSGFDPTKAKEAFLWLMCKVNSPEQLDVQDMNRLKTFFKIQGNRRLSLEGKYFDISHIEKDYDCVFKSFPPNRSIRVKAVADFKLILQDLIDDVFDQYEDLCAYREYVMTINSYSDDMSINQDIYDLRCAMVIVSAVKKVFITMFCGYLKIPGLESGHSDFSYVQFSRSNISNSNFFNSDFKCANIDNSIATGSDFSICNFLMCNAKGATLNDCTFNYSNMSGMDLSSATLSNSLLDAVIFRYNQLDDSIEFAEELLGNSEDQTRSGLYKKLFDERDVALKEIRAVVNNESERLENVESGKLPVSSVNSIRRYSINQIREFAKALSKGSDDPELRKMTYAREDDQTPKLLKNGGETEFDNVLEEMKRRLEPMLDFCKKKVIGKELLNYLSEAEEVESTERREKRFSDYGEICFKPTVLRGTTFSKCSIPQIDLSHIDMTNASFKECDMSRCMGYYSTAKNASFAGTNIIGGEFFESCFDNSNFSEGNCINATFINCGLHSLSISKALANGIAIVNLKRNETFLSKLLIPITDEDKDYFLSNLSENVDDEYFTDEELDMADSNWAGTSASNAIFIGVKMDRSNFSNADLSSSLFFNCATRWATFSGCDFPYALLQGTSFHQSTFAGSTLSQTRVFCCEFTGCSMANMTFTGALCDKAIFYTNDISNANFSRSHFRNCIFRSCNFENLNISNCLFEHCTFYDVDFCKCVGLENAVFKKCIFDSKLPPATTGVNLLDEDYTRRIILNSKKDSELKIDDVFVEKCESFGKYDLYDSIQK